MKINLVKDLTALKVAKISQIDADANRASERYRTSGEHTVAVYALKRAELSAYHAGRPISELAMLQAEAKALSLEPESVLANWRSKMLIEDNGLPKIEAVRLSLKQQIRAATTPDEIEAIMAEAVWP